MKKFLMILAVLVLGLACTATAYDVVTNNVGGAYPGPSMMDKVYTVNGVYDFALNDYDTNDIIQLVDVPAGVLPLYLTLASTA